MGFYIKLDFCFFKHKSKTLANIAPEKFAKTSNTSAFRVVVNNSCNISMVIPRKIESSTVIINNLILFSSL